MSWLKVIKKSLFSRFDFKQTKGLYNNPDFDDILIERLYEQPAWKVEKVRGESYSIIISDTLSGKCIYVEFQWAGEYGELPMGSIIPLAKQIKRLPKKDKLFLITFSDISNLLASKFKQIGIIAFSKPTLEDVVNNVQLAFSS